MVNPVKSKGLISDIPTRSLKDIEISGKVLEYIPQESVEHYRVVPIGVRDGILEVGATNPNDLEARDALNFISSRIGMPYKLFLISENDFTLILERYKGLSGEVTKALSELESELSAAVPPETKGGKKEDKQESPDARIVEDAPVTKIVATILNYASEGRASDIHIEPTHENVRVRFRVDGVLNTSLILPLKVHSAVVARIKILSNMRLDEKRKPQDGRFSAKIEDRKIDFRVSTFPTYYGEKVVMRILDQSQGIRTLDDMDFSDTNLKLIRKALQRPYGLVLITGPTGSGKSTTLYAMLKEVDRDHKNVLSLEDPVEYSIDGVSQSQIHPEIDYTFATGLRTTLRQDPDVIMVGEIRDKETAQLAIQAALTGHLVFSTLHTNNAIGVVPRLVDMGIDPYLIPPTLILAIAQRLVPTLCADSKKPVALAGSLKERIQKEISGLPESTRKTIKLPQEIYQPLPSPKCPRGTEGRVAVYEVLKSTRELEEIILKDPNEAKIMK